MTTDDARCWQNILAEEINLAQKRLRAAVSPEAQKVEQKHINSRVAFYNLLKAAIERAESAALGREARPLDAVWDVASVRDAA